MINFVKRFLLIGSLTCVCINLTWACQKPISILYGPFITEWFINAQLKDTHNKIAEFTQCQVTFHISKNYLFYQNKIKQKEYDIVLVSSPQAPYILPIGYQRLAYGLGPVKLGVYSRLDGNINTLKDLKNKQVLLNGDTSIAAIGWQHMSSKALKSNEVGIVYTVDTDALLIRLLKGDAQAATTFQPFYKRLPKSLQDKLILLDQIDIKHPGAILLNKDRLSHLQNNIKEAYLSTGNWHDENYQLEIPISPSIHEKLINTFSADH